MGNPGSTSGNCGQAGALAAAGAAVREGLGQEWRGAPAAWIEAYAALRGAIGEAFGAHAALQRSLTESVTAEWFLGMAARAHLNAFRVELPRPVASMDEGGCGGVGWGWWGRWVGRERCTVTEVAEGFEELPVSYGAQGEQGGLSC